MPRRSVFRRRRADQRKVSPMKQFGITCVVVLLSAVASAQSPAALPDWSGVWQMMGGTVFDRATATGPGAVLTPGLRSRPPYNAKYEAIYSRNVKLRDQSQLPDPINTCGTPAG